MLEEILRGDVARWWRNGDRPTILRPTVYCPDFDPAVRLAESRQGSDCRGLES